MGRANVAHDILGSMNNKTIPHPKGVLFDMDGVLLLEMQQSSQSWQQVCQQVASVLSLPAPTLVHAIAESRRAYQQSLEGDEEKQRRDRLEPFLTRREMVERALRSVGQENVEIASAMVQAYEALRDEYRQLAPHALETLEYFRSKGIPLALLSNGNATYQRQKIKRHHLAPYFSLILIEEEYGVAKPDPRPFLSALSHLHIDAQEAWMIGDNLTLDIAASQRLNIFAIWCDFARQGLPESSPVQPDQIIHSLDDLRPLYERG